MGVLRGVVTMEETTDDNIVLSTKEEMEDDAITEKILEEAP